MIESADLPRFDWLRALVAFADSGHNLTHAARAVGISQPALHQQLAQLAEALGVTLYRRVGRRLLPTPAGDRATTFARDVLAQVGAFAHELRTGRDDRPVVLAAGEGAFLYLLGDAIRRFRAQAGGAPLALMTCDWAAGLAAVQEGRADLAVGAGNIAPPHLASAPLVSLPLALALPPDHLWAASTEPVALTDVSAAPLILPPRGRPVREAAELAARGALSVAVEARGWPLVLHFTRLGIGLGVINRFPTLPDDLVYRPIADLPHAEYRVVWRQGRPPRPPVERLMALLGPR